MAALSEATSNMAALNPAQNYVSCKLPIANDCILQALYPVHAGTGSLALTRISGWIAIPTTVIKKMHFGVLEFYTDFDDIWALQFHC